MINKLCTFILLLVPNIEAISIDQTENQEIQIDQTEQIDLEENSQWSLTPITNKQAQCYLNRYPDLQRAFGRHNINRAKWHWNHYGVREHRHKTCEKPLSNREGGCYAKRYEDLAKAWEGKGLGEQIRLAKEHWLEYGIHEGRQRYCAPRITEQQAKCYLNQYPQIWNRFGVAKNAWVQAQQHFYKIGFHHGKVAKCKTPVASCASGTEGPTCTCAADGLIYFGKRYNTYRGNLPAKATFEQMYNWKTAVSKPIGGRQTCNYHALSDPWPGIQKQCFCESKVHVKPIKLGNQGGNWKRATPHQRPVPIIHNHRCNNWQHMRIANYNDRDYTVQECDKMCDARDDCYNFMTGTRGNKIGDCELYKKGCSWYPDNRMSFYRPSKYRTGDQLHDRPDVCPLTSYVYYGRLYQDDKRTKLTFDEMVKQPYERSLVTNTWQSGCTAQALELHDFDTHQHKQCFCDYDDFYSDDQYNKDQIEFDNREKKAEADKLAAQRKREEDARRKAEAAAKREADEKRAALKRLEDAAREAASNKLERERARQKKLETKEEKKDEKKEESKEGTKIESGDNWVDEIIKTVPAYKKFSRFTD